jgi:hypothetical protein
MKFAGVDDLLTALAANSQPAQAGCMKLTHRKLSGVGVAHRKLAGLDYLYTH